MNQLLCAVAFFALIYGFGQAPLDLKEIMGGQQFTGYWPEGAAWNIDGSSFMFRWNKDGKDDAECYLYAIKTKKLQELSEAESREFIPFDGAQVAYHNQLSLVEQSLVLTDRRSMKNTVLFQTHRPISQLSRAALTEATFFMEGDFYQLIFDDNGLKRLVQLTSYTNQQKKKDKDTSYLERQQVELFQFVRDHTPKENKGNRSAYESVKSRLLPSENISGHFLSSKNGVVLLREDAALKDKPTEFMRFVTADGFTAIGKARAKVSQDEPHQKMHMHWLKEDSLITLDFSKLTDIRKKPEYMDTSGGILFSKDRHLFIHDPVFANTKPLALLDVRAADNKDRWIVLLDLKTGKMQEIERQHDEAWIGGPGISEWNMENATLGFVQDDEVVYFQSEVSGFSQLYELSLEDGRKELVYPGGEGFEMQSVELGSDGFRYFITHNASKRISKSFSCIHRIHRKMVPLLGEGTGGVKEVAVSPNGQGFVYLYSAANAPWELYFLLKGEKPVKITTSTTPKFNAYPWRVPEYVQFTASDGMKVFARLYQPSIQKNHGAAVLFVHGAGYLQNAHSWWSSYYREYMFHNLLADKGYTVLDVDYRASSGYGRNYRTAIYRNMGGRDVLDFIDAKKYLFTLGVDTNRVGIYGGSYGGFVTLMSLFKHPTAFACGAALRSVTDWAHYNHEYTSNILNYPETDPEAYRKSSPIYFAEGLSRPLLMLHGMVDDNVQFQDIVRLQQRLIELGKTQWELAAYPVEGHGFQESYSWHDEYRRILELFEKHLSKK